MPRNAVAVLLSLSPLLAQNNECAGAVTLALGTNGPFTNVGSTTSAPAWPCGSGGNDVWYSYTAAHSGAHTFKTCTGTRTYDSTIQVFSGSCASLVNLACNDDFCGLGSQVQVTLTGGNTYLVRVGGFANATGNFDVVVAIGSGNGVAVAETPSGCGTAQLAVTGSPNLGASVTATMTGHGGVPFLGLGFQQYATLFCNCTIGTDWSFVVPSATWSTGIPVNPALVNVRFFVQGVDFGGPAGCQIVPFALTDTWRITIG